MKTIGITGSIGMGKSSVAGMFRREGVPVHDADASVHKLLTQIDVKRAIQSAFPIAVYPEIYKMSAAFLKHRTKYPEINRSALGRVIFKDEGKRKALEAILHPAVRADQSKFYARHFKAGAPLIGFDVPLLFETGADLAMDAVINVEAPYHTQRMRVLARPNMSEEKFHSILDNQMPSREKSLRADYTVHTGVGRAHSIRQVKRIIAQMCERGSRRNEILNSQDNIERIMVQQFKKK
jgi:dephospho-CoA kinase